MAVKFGKGFERVETAFNTFVDADMGLSSALQDLEITMGLSGQPGFGTPAHAKEPLFVGDAAVIGNRRIDAVTEALLQKDPTQVGCKPVFNSATQKFDYEFKRRAPAADAYDPLGGMFYSPWNIAYFKRVFKQPLSYSHASEFVSREAGTEPFAQVMALPLMKYAGWARIEQTGDLQSQTSDDVNVRMGVITQNVINISGTYTITLEDREIASRGANPFGMQGISEMQKYLRYAMNMLKDYLIIFGNASTETAGIINSMPAHTWGGDSLTKIFHSTSEQAKGNVAYTNLAGIVNDFLTRSDNKFRKIKIGMSPQALNYLRSMPYSNSYNPQSAFKIFMENYFAGQGKDGSSLPLIEFVSEPLLKAHNPLNDATQQSDYLIITCPEVETGTDDEVMPTMPYGVPLEEFIFPALPGNYNTQYKMLSRVAGLFNIVPSACQVWEGFGVATDSD